MNSSVAIRLKENDRKRFDNARYLISYISDQDNLEKALEHLDTYDKALFWLSHFLPKPVYTEHIKNFEGDKLYLFGVKDMWYVSDKRPDGIIYFYALEDSI